MLYTHVPGGVDCPWDAIHPAEHVWRAQGGCALGRAQLATEAAEWWKDAHREGLCAGLGETLGCRALSQQIGQHGRAFKHGSRLCALSLPVQACGAGVVGQVGGTCAWQGQAPTAEECAAKDKYVYSLACKPQARKTAQT